ncbi:Putative cell wall binding repeat 2 [Agrococcus baldri]|uniref:Cell wall binding repeat 2 n=1 Tax=Agrococcus baldri TaxID=153730 RepID=A0AA94KYC9_9MICO|nr:cell wall-binding repeat-containing protein [Agrococcus baldri]SFR97582.1 Putative cell wall binding repeat 2 [Agrococcus baldri]
MRALLALAAALSLVATGLVTAAPAAEAASTTRIAGSDRFATSVEISRQTPATGDVVYLANGLKFPDALAAGPVVAAEGGHLLLTPPNQLHAAVAERIRELAPSEIVVVGSAASVSDAVAAAALAAAQADGDEAEETLTRVGGANRVETSLLLLERLRESGGVNSVWVASGANFPDALVAASVAGRDRSAVVLDHHAPTPQATQAWLDRVGPQVAGLRVNIAGGTPSVSAADQQGLLVHAAEIQRYAGSDRYQTAMLINQQFPAASTEPAMLLATGQNFPDALAGAVHAALRDVPMLLTPNACHATITPKLQAEADRLGVTTVIGLGSSATISDLALRLGPCPLTLPQTIAAQYGTFAPQQHSGTGSRLIDLGARGIPYAQLRATMSSGGVNRVVMLDADRQLLDEPISYQGPYSGTALLAAFHERPVRYLNVETTGTWTLRLTDLSSAPTLGTPLSGDRDAVFIYGGPARTVTASHGGNLFAVIELLDGGASYRVPFQHCCEPLNGSISTMAAGPAVVAVMSDSPWRLTVREFAADAPVDAEPRSPANAPSLLTEPSLLGEPSQTASDSVTRSSIR